ncbi:MAG TPA: NifB/NifX family molybdenum-iron cluster-binding protein [Candidatus Limnocylindria bacterium]|nr:NifB/NifX family molybdenum-iron cluster-binding protein [Candidatus Limnocylindria bacterium]
MIVCLPVTADGLLGPRWGRADRVAVADVAPDGIRSWAEHDVGWGALHDAGAEGQHHARIARFLREHRVEAVVAQHVGGGMEQMLRSMGIPLRLAPAGDAKGAALVALRTRGSPLH